MFIPKHLEPFVEAEFLVAGHYGDIFANGLGNDLAAEKIGVLERQIEKANCLSDIRTSANRHSSAGIKMRELPVLENPHIIVVIPVFGRCPCGVDRS